MNRLHHSDVWLFFAAVFVLLSLWPRDQLTGLLILMLGAFALRYGRDLETSRSASDGTSPRSGGGEVSIPDPAQTRTPPECPGGVRLALPRRPTPRVDRPSRRRLGAGGIRAALTT